MLAFFRKYEKTFMLIILAPALVAMGITGTVLSVVGQQDDIVAGRVFGEEVTGAHMQRFLKMYQSTAPQASEEQAFEFMALLRASERAGIRVSDEELGKKILTTSRWDIAQYLAAEEVKKKGLDLRTKEGQQEWQRIFFQMMAEAPTYDPALFRKVIEERNKGNLTVREYEEQERREAMVMRYLDALRELGTVSPDEVWEQFQEQNHLRVLELASIPAKDHLPDPTATDPKSKGFISDEQIAAFHEANIEDYDLPRKERLELVGVVLADLEEEADPADGEAFVEDQRAVVSQLVGIADVGTDDYADLTDADQKKVLDYLTARRREAKADLVMNEVATRVREATGKGLPADLAAITSAVAEKTGAKLVYEKTDLVDRSWVDGHAVLGDAFAARNWFDEKGEKGDVSDVLAGPRGWFVLRVVDIQHQRRPDFAEVKEQVKQDYANGSEKERKRHYDAFKGTRYKGDLAYRLQAFVLTDAAAGDHAKARGELEALKTLSVPWGAGFPKFKIQEADTTQVPHAASIETPSYDKLTRAELEKHEVLGKAASLVAGMAATPNVLSDPIETADGKGWLLFRVEKAIEPQLQGYDEVATKVADAVRLERGVERARAWGERLLPELRGLEGEALKKALADRGLKAEEKPPVARNATTLEGVQDAGRLISDAFGAEVVPGGPFARVEASPDGSGVYLVRVAKKVDASEAEYALQFAGVRKDLLRKTRGDFADAMRRKTMLEAKGISADHVKYAAALRDGPDGVVKLKLRQVYVPPDRAVIEGWLEARANEVMAAVRKDLAAGRTWDYLVDKYSEDDATRARRGELPPVARNDLLEDFGNDFVEAAFTIAEGAISEPVKSKRGLHLVQRTGWADATRTRATIRHLLIKTDAEARRLTQAVKDEAEAKAKAKVEDAWKKLEAGTPFGQVARETGDERDPIGQGQEFDVDWTTPFERAALAAPTDWEPAEGSEEAKDMAWVPAAVEVDGPDENRWHLLACSASRGDRGSEGEQRDREVFHIAASTKDGIESVRDRLTKWMRKKAAEEEDRPGWGAILEQFKEVARDHSKAPTRQKGGAFGLVQLEGDVRAYGPEFLAKVTGAAPKAGARLAAFRGATGWHIVEVVEVVKAKADRQGEVEDAVLAGTGWR